MPVISKPNVQTSVQAKPEAPAAAPAASKPITQDDKMSKAEWANKDHRISFQGLLQAALPYAMANSLSEDEFVQTAIRVAERFYAKVQEIK